MSPFGQAISTFLAFLLLSWSVQACQDSTAELPKPHAYPKIEFPHSDSVATFRVQVCPFTFQHPSYVEVEQDTLFFDDKPKHPCWFDLVTPTLSGRVHVSYYPINSEADFEKHRDDVYTLVGKHNVVASYIDEKRINYPDKGIYGYAFSVEGNAASPYQLFLTDSTRHFLRAAVYVNAQAKADSLAPVYEFLQRDLESVVESLVWK